MSAFTYTAATAEKARSVGEIKTIIMTIAGSASYDTGGSVLDLSDLFTKVYGVEIIGVGAAASSKYKGTFTPGASDAAATGKIKMNDITAASGAEVSSTTDLSALTFVVRVTGK